MTREPCLRSRLNAGPAADRVLLPNRRPASSGLTGSIERPSSAAVVAALNSSPHRAVGEVTAIHAFHQFRRIADATLRSGALPRRTRPASSPGPVVRTDPPRPDLCRFRSAANDRQRIPITLTIGTRRGACNY